MAPPVEGTPYAVRRRRPRWLRQVLLAMLLVPVVEIVVIIQVGKLIGGWPTFGLLVLESLFGAWLVRREGTRAWRALSEALRTGRMPSRELADAALVLVGGALLLTPGFVTDVVGLLVVLPVTRPVARRFFEAAVARRLLGAWTVAGRAGGPGPDVVPGEVRHDQDPD